MGRIEEKRDKYKTIKWELRNAVNKERQSWKLGNKLNRGVKGNIELVKDKATAKRTHRGAQSKKEEKGKKEKIVRGFLEKNGKRSDSNKQRVTN